MLNLYAYENPHILLNHSFNLNWRVQQDAQTLSNRYHPLLDQEVYGLEGEGVQTRGTRHTSVLRDAPSIDISPLPVEETPITPMEVPSTPPIVPLVASLPQSIEATLVDKEMIVVEDVVGDVVVELMEGYMLAP
ncbi:hypothetical protein AAG906_006126 [Vitis piasezkii]